MIDQVSVVVAIHEDGGQYPVRAYTDRADAVTFASAKNRGIRDPDIGSDMGLLGVIAFTVRTVDMFRPLNRDRGDEK